MGSEDMLFYNMYGTATHQMVAKDGIDLNEECKTYLICVGQAHLA